MPRDQSALGTGTNDGPSSLPLWGLPSWRWGEKGDAGALDLLGHVSADGPDSEIPFGRCRIDLGSDSTPCCVFLK